MAALVVGFLRTSIGGGIGLVLTPTLSLVLPAPVVLALVAPLMNLSDPIALRYYWGQWDARQMRLLMPTALVGVALGAWALSRLPVFWIGKVIGAVALVLGVLQLVAIGRRRPAAPAPPPRSVGVAAGLLTGAASMIAHSGGVIVSLYLVRLRLPTTAILATGNAVYVFANLVKVAGYWQIGFLTGPIVLSALAASPLIVAGAWLGYRVNRRLPRRAFELAIVAIAIAGALRLLLRG